VDIDYLGRLLAIDDLGARIGAVEDRMLEALLVDSTVLGSPSARVASGGGKRLRPILALAAANIEDRFDSAVISAATSVELVQVGSLVHDDIFDLAATRRGVPTINSVEGDHQAILAGDFILARAGVQASRVGAEAARVLAATVVELCVGQHLETRRLGALDRSIEEHFASIEAKTASLFDVSCRIGSLAAEADTATVAALGRFGRNYGMAFQIIDDVLDLIADPVRLGKPVGSDVRAGVYTLPVLEVMNGPQGDDLRRLLVTEDVDEAVSARVAELVSETGAVERALSVAVDFERAAVDALEGLGEHPTIVGLRAFPGAYREWAMETLT